MNKSTLRVLAITAGALWAIALVLPAFRIAAGGFYSGTYSGFVVAIIGPLAISQGVFSWFANIYWAYTAVRMIEGNAPNFYLAGANSLLAGSFLLGVRALGDSEYSAPQIGAWVWLLSFAPSLIAGMAAALSQSLRDAKT